jgi:hypothetical protein
MNGLDELSSAADALEPDGEEDDSKTGEVDHVALASLHLRKLIYNMVLIGGGDFQRVVNNQWRHLKLMNPSVGVPRECEILYKSLRIKVPSGPNKIVFSLVVLRVAAPRPAFGICWTSGIFGPGI